MEKTRLDAQRVYEDAHFRPAGGWADGHDRKSDHMGAGILRGPVVPADEPRRSIYIEWRRRNRVELLYQEALRKIRNKARDDYGLPE